MQDSFYKSLTPEQSEQAFKSNYDFDSPDAIDFDILVGRLRCLKNGYVRSGESGGYVLVVREDVC